VIKPRKKVSLKLKLVPSFFFLGAMVETKRDPKAIRIHVCIFPMIVLLINWKRANA
jgi:hypothetical protein